MTDYLHTELLGFYVRSFDALTTRELYEMLRARADVFVGEQKILFPDTDASRTRMELTIIAFMCFLSMLRVKSQLTCGCF